MGLFGWRRKWHGFSVGKSYVDALWSVSLPFVEVMVGFPSKVGGVRGTVAIALGREDGTNLWLWIGDRRLEGDDRLRPTVYVVR